MKNCFHYLIFGVFMYSFSLISMESEEIKNAKDKLKTLQTDIKELRSSASNVQENKNEEPMGAKILRVVDTAATIYNTLSVVLNQNTDNSSDDIKTFLESTRALSEQMTLTHQSLVKFDEFPSTAVDADKNLYQLFEKEHAAFKLQADNYYAQFLLKPIPIVKAYIAAPSFNRLEIEATVNSQHIKERTENSKKLLGLLKSQGVSLYPTLFALKNMCEQARDRCDIE
jgi:hypothetical protein